MSALAPGMLVVCVDDRPHPGMAWDEEEAPHAGYVYTIRRRFIDVKGVTVIDFEELKRSEYSIELHGGEVGYHPRRFRPLSGDRLAIIRQHLTGVPSKTKEPA